MARRKKSDSDTEGNGAEVGHNSNGKQKTLADHLESLDAADDKLEKLKSQYMTKCKGPRGEIREIGIEVADAGLATKAAWRTIVRDRRHKRKLAAIIRDMEPDDVESYQDARHALGDLADTPLGAAALRSSEALSSLTDSA